jgi:hypothetical protein
MSHDSCRTPETPAFLAARRLSQDLRCFLATIEKVVRKKFLADAKRQVTDMARELALSSI